MKIRHLARAILALFLLVVCVSAQSGPQTDTSSISGTVVNTATGKPEAGVWVIAETKLGVPYRKIFDPKKETWTVFRLPYPMPFYTRGLDGRIDNPNTGWKGRGIWTSYNSYLPKFSETKLGYLNHIQFRPNPLAN
jgi:hypothetical protein